MSTYRLLVTGSRALPDPRPVHCALAEAWVEIRQATEPGIVPRIVVVHGDCPTGADAFADAWARRHADCCGIEVEAHPADWEKYGKTAGPVRNERMVSLGAWRVLAFPYGESRGTHHCIAAARRAGLTVHVAIRKGNVT